MKTFISKFLLIACVAIIHTNATVSIKYFTQKVDHFNETDETFKQRYFENRVVYEEGGPIILFIGGNEVAEPQFILGGPLLEVAAEHKGVLIYLEHRYFGNSIPFDGNLTLENLKYLTVQNALEDVTYFIKYLNVSQYEAAKVILAGSSYSGALVIWHRQAYPYNVTNGAWVSSPKMLSKPDVPEYKQGISANMIKFNSACNNKIHAGIEEMLFELTWLNQTRRIEQNFRLCSPIDTNDKNGVMYFFHVVTTMLEVVKERDAASILCRTITSIEDNIMALAMALYSQIGIVDCLDASYATALETYQNEWDTTNQRAELYLACYQVGWFRSGKSRLQPFGYLPTFDYFVDLCRNSFDPAITAEKLQENSDKLNKKYGGLTPFVSSVFTTYGDADPEISLGPTKSFGSSNSRLEDIRDAQRSYDLYWWIYPRTNTNIDWAINRGKDYMKDYLK